MGHLRVWSILLHHLHRAGHELQSARVRREPSVRQPMLKRLGVGARRCLFSTFGRQCSAPQHMDLRFERFGSGSALPVTARRRVARNLHRLSRRNGSAEHHHVEVTTPHTQNVDGTRCVVPVVLWIIWADETLKISRTVPRRDDPI